MMDANETVTKYEVKWHVSGSDRRHVTMVNIIPGYSTVDDIPTIIAVSRTGRPEDAELIEVDEITPKGSA